MILVIDNYDSFTYNLVHYLEALGQSIVVRRNNEITLESIRMLNPSHLLISPGPGRPEDAGITLDCIRTFSGKIPILGVCLGHQAIGIFDGAKVINAKHIMHGKTSLIYHNNSGVFHHLPSPFRATRYHSLVIDKDTLSDAFEITAWTENQEIMGIRHRDFPLEGVQFHPESVLTEHGYTLLNTFIRETSCKDPKPSAFVTSH